MNCTSIGRNEINPPDKPACAAREHCGMNGLRRHARKPRRTMVISETVTFRAFLHYPEQQVELQSAEIEEWDNGT
jgi:hypothetical protein